MTTINDGGPAFPAKASIDRSTGELQSYQFGNHNFDTLGLSLRDYFAAKAMAGFLSSGRVNPDHAAGIFADEVSKKAYALADAMLAARGAQ